MREELTRYELDAIVMKIAAMFPSDPELQRECLVTVEYLLDTPPEPTPCDLLATHT